MQFCHYCRVKFLMIDNIHIMAYHAVKPTDKPII